MNKPTTIIIPDYITDYLRDGVQSRAHGTVIDNVQHDEDKLFQPMALNGLQTFSMRPVYGDAPPALDKLRMFHVEFGKFPLNDKDPLVSCHMIGHVFWNATLKQELVSIRWRFNLNSDAQTNAYVTYL